MFADGHAKCACMHVQVIGPEHPSHVLIFPNRTYAVQRTVIMHRIRRRMVSWLIVIIMPGALDGRMRTRAMYPYQSNHHPSLFMKGPH